jgi:hypothetical protein
VTNIAEAAYRYRIQPSQRATSIAWPASRPFS